MYIQQDLDFYHDANDRKIIKGYERQSWKEVEKEKRSLKLNFVTDMKTLKLITIALQRKPQTFYSFLFNQQSI